MDLDDASNNGVLIVRSVFIASCSVFDSATMAYSALCVSVSMSAPTPIRTLHSSEWWFCAANLKKSLAAFVHPNNSDIRRIGLAHRTYMERCIT